MSGRNVAALVAVALVVLVSLVLVPSGGGMMGWATGSGMMGWGGGGFAGWWVVALIVGALVIGGVATLGASRVNTHRPAVRVPIAASARPLDILRERFARGELTREEFDRMRTELDR